MTRLETTETLTLPDGTPYQRYWYCKHPGDRPYKIIRATWQDDPLALSVEHIYEIKLTTLCSAPRKGKPDQRCDSPVLPPRRRFCSDPCARRARRAEKNVEAP